MLRKLCPVPIITKVVSDCVSSFIVRSVSHSRCVMHFSQKVAFFTKSRGKENNTF